MAHLWVRDATEWVVAPLVVDTVTLTAQPPYVAARLPGPGEVSLMRTMRQYDAVETGSQWVVLLDDSTRVRVNGAAVLGGIQVLDDRDEIRGIGLGRHYFSTETLAAVTPLPVTPDRLVCPRCKLPVEPGSLAVCCPVCGVWHHERKRRSCWTYSEECALCRHPTDLNRGYQWSPEAL